MDDDEDFEDDDDEPTQMSVVYMMGSAHRHSRWTIGSMVAALAANVMADISEFCGQLSRASLQHGNATDLRTMEDSVTHDLERLTITEE
jgi:hypothetical protein